MRQFSDLPRDDGSRRFQRCPPSHHEMALTPHLAQASARAPRPSLPTPPSTVSSAQVSPYQQRGSTITSRVLGIASPSPLHGPQEHGGGLYTSRVLRPLVWVVGTHAHVIWGVNAIIFPSPRRVFCKHGGGIFPDGSTLYAVGGGDSIQSPDGHRRMGCSRMCGRGLRVRA